MLLALVVALLQSDRAEVRARLDELRADTAAERSSAQRWLARNLSELDLDALRAAATGGDAEVRRRLVLALADDDTHLELAARLAADREAPVAAVGRSAVVERILAWCPSWGRLPLPHDEALEALGDEYDRPIALDPRSRDGRLDVALDQLARFAPGAPSLVLDPDLALSDHPRDPAGEIEAAFPHLLGELVRLHRADLEGFDLGEQHGSERARDDAPALRPWIRVRRSVAQDPRTAAELVAEWCLAVAAGSDLARRAASARAIAATSWPGGIGWLESRWLAHADEAALEGVLLAASRGQVSPGLGLPDRQRALYAELRRDAADPARRRRADTTVRALAAVGPRGREGEDLAAIAALDLATLPAQEQWLRLVVLEGIRATSPDVAAAIEAILRARETPAPVVFQALRARFVTAPRAAPGLAVADTASLLDWADRAELGEECAQLLAALGVEPGPMDAVANRDRRPASRLVAEAEWRFHVGSPQSRGDLLARLSAPPEEGGLGLEALAATTRRWVLRGERPRLEQALAAAREPLVPRGGSLGAETQDTRPRAGGAERPAAARRSGPDAERLERLDRLEILSGAGSPELRARARADWATNPRTRIDVLSLSSLAADPGGESARDALLRALADPALQRDSIVGLERTVEDLRAARREEALRELVQLVRKAAREGSAELRARLHPDSWPPRGTLEVIQPALLDRSLERSGL